MRRPSTRRFLSSTSHERIADLIDIYRIFPRMFVLGYGILCWRACLWYMDLPAPSNNQAAFVTLLSGFFVPLMNWYMQNGRPTPIPLAAPTVTAAAAPGTTATASVSIPDPSKK